MKKAEQIIGEWQITYGIELAPACAGRYEQFRGLRDGIMEIYE